MMAVTFRAQPSEIVPGLSNRSWRRLITSLARGLEYMGASVVELLGSVNADSCVERGILHPFGLYRLSLASSLLFSGDSGRWSGEVCHDRAAFWATS